MKKFHVNSKTGVASVCRAKYIERCPFGGENHADTLEDARGIYERSMVKDLHKPLNKVKTLSLKDIGETPRNINNPELRIENMRGSSLAKINPAYTYLDFYVGAKYKIIGPAKTKNYENSKVWQIPVVKDGVQSILEVPHGGIVPVTVDATYHNLREKGSSSSSDLIKKVDKVNIKYGDDKAIKALDLDSDKVTLSTIGEIPRDLPENTVVKEITGTILKNYNPESSMKKYFFGDNYQVSGAAKIAMQGEKKVWVVPVTKDGKESELVLPTRRSFIVTMEKSGVVAEAEQARKKEDGKRAKESEKELQEDRKWDSNPQPLAVNLGDKSHVIIETSMKENSLGAYELSPSVYNQKISEIAQSSEDKEEVERQIVALRVLYVEKMIENLNKKESDTDKIRAKTGNFFKDTFSKFRSPNENDMAEQAKAADDNHAQTKETERFAKALFNAPLLTKLN